MAEDSTRRLLRVFGIAATDYENAVGEPEAALRGVDRHGSPRSSLGACDRAAREAEARWGELGRLIQGYQARARVARVAALHAPGVA